MSYREGDLNTDGLADFASQSPRISLKHEDLNAFTLVRSPSPKQPSKLKKQSQVSASRGLTQWTIRQILHNGDNSRNTTVLTVLDYSEIAFQLMKKSFPSRRAGKAVLIQNEHDEFVVLAPAEFCRLHADIASRFFELNQIATRSTCDRVEPLSNSWRVIGGCYFEVNDELKAMKVDGDSTAYGCVDLAYLRQQIQQSHQFKTYDVTN